MDPVRSTTAVLRRPANPNKGYTRGLLDIAGWQSMPLTVAAQKVQISAYPDAYAKWEIGRDGLVCQLCAESLTIGPQPGVQPAVQESPNLHSTGECLRPPIR